MLRRKALGLLAMLLLAGCHPVIANEPTVYEPVSGRVSVRWRLSAAGISEIFFLLDDQQLGSSKDVSDSFVFQVDTTRVENGIHRLKAVAVDASGQTVRTVEHALLVSN